MVFNRVRVEVFISSKKGSFSELEVQISALHRNHVAASKATRTQSTVSSQTEHSIHVASSAIRLHCPFHPLSLQGVSQFIVLNMLRFDASLDAGGISLQSVDFLLLYAGLIYSTASI